MLNAQASLSSNTPALSHNSLSSKSSSPPSYSYNNADLKQPRQRSRNGCFTCRKRKKRCDEGKPVCNACTRLSLECTYPIPGQERKNKKRKSQLADEHKSNSGNSQQSSTSADEGPSPSKRSKHSSNKPSKPRVAENNKSRSSSQPSLSTSSQNDMPSLPSSKYDSPSETSSINYTQLLKDNHPRYAALVGLSSPLPTTFGADLSHSEFDAIESLVKTTSGIFSSAGTPHNNTETHNNSNNISSSNNNTFSPGTFNSMMNGFQSPFFGPLTPQQAQQQGSSDFLNPTLGENLSTDPANASNAAGSASPSSHANSNSGGRRSSYHSPQFRFSSAEIFSPNVAMAAAAAAAAAAVSNSPNLFPRSIHSLIASPTFPPSSPRIELLDSQGNPEVTENNQDKSADTEDTLNRQFQNSHDVISSFNQELDFPYLDNDDLDNEKDKYDGQYSPLALCSSPSPWYASYLDNIGIEMFAYYNNYLANMINVSSKINSFLNVFVPMAQEDPSVLYALVAYASFHHSMGRHEDVGLRYLNTAIKMARNDLPKHKLTTLAAILIISTAEICKGDMVHWNRHLNAAADVIQMRGGMEHFVNDPTKRWLATNFVYHDILAASKYEHKPHFEPKDYNMILRMDPGVHSLIGCCKPIFALMAEISDLAVEAQEIYSQYSSSKRSKKNKEENKSSSSPEQASSSPSSLSSSSTNEGSPASRIMNMKIDSNYHNFNKDENNDDDDDENESVDSFLMPSVQRKLIDKMKDLHDRARELEQRIDTCKPDPNDIMNLKSGDLEEQLTLFETFQLAAKLHLLQSVFRRNAGCLEMQVIACELTTSLDVVLNTKVEASVVFPLFIAGIMATSDRQRQAMMARFDGFYKRQLARNIVRACNLAEEVWKLDHHGTKYVNWYKVIQQHGWDICFS